jgi:DNA replication ATP-dependent helicase Dna2
MVVTITGMRLTCLSFVDTVDRFQCQERDLIIASYTVADRDFVVSEAEFNLDPRRFNVTLTRTRSKFMVFVSDVVIGHLPSDAEVARDAPTCSFSSKTTVWTWTSG